VLAANVRSMTTRIDCDTCVVRGLACHDCVVTVLLGPPPEMGFDEEDRELLVYFMAIEACKFRRMVVPGDVLELKVNTTRGKPGGKVWRFHGEATVAGELACEADFTAMMDMPKE